MDSVEALIRQMHQMLRSKWEALFICLITMSIVSSAKYQKQLLVTGADTVFPITSGTEDTAELSMMAAGSGNDETPIDTKLQKSLKTPCFPPYPFCMDPLTTLQLHWHESSTTEQKGSSLNIREVIFNYFIVIKSFPRYSIITVAHTSIVWHLLRQTRQVIMSFFMYSSMEHISVTEFEETLLVLYSLKQDFILTSISTDA